MGDMLVLVVDDDRPVREALERALQLHGYEVELASDGDSALAAVEARTPDALVLDVMMPGLDGLDVTRRLRREGNRVPILLLTARDAIGDRVEGLDAGADDYLAKPYDLEELLARLRAVLRRALPEAPGEVLRFADLTLDLGSMDARRGGRRFELTTTEAHLLELFMRNPDRCCRARSSTSASGATTSATPRTRSTSTSATCAGRRRPTRSRA